MIEEETARSDARSNKPLLRALRGEASVRPPWWLMRQAGRYLPEYRALRARAHDFVEFCLTPGLAAEATLQPLHRYGMDGAILFADILLLPRSLGQPLNFGDDGPSLPPLDDASGVAALRLDGLSALDPVYETVRLCRSRLPSAATLIGFAGAPWTVATYMVEGGASRDFQRVKAWSYRDPAGFAGLIDLITEATITYLGGQIMAGAEVVQLFDTWAGVLSESGFEQWVIVPMRRITGALHERFPGVPIVGFPRGAGALYERYAVTSGVDAISLDTTVPMEFARVLQRHVVVQGNLDPVTLLVGGASLESAVAAIRLALYDGAFVFNIGHGILPQTPPENVAALAELLAEPVHPG